MVIDRDLLEAAARAARHISGGMDPDFVIAGCARRHGVNPGDLVDYLYPRRGLRRIIRAPGGETLFSRARDV